jgi:hypothetical protein
MAAKHFVFALCTLSLLQTSFAGFDRFWSKDGTLTESTEAWEGLSEVEQEALIRRYQSLKELPAEQGATLQQRMDWFTQLPEKEKQQIREVWQQMSTHERQDLRARMEKATPEERASIRKEYLFKYQQVSQNN